MNSIDFQKNFKGFGTGLDGFSNEFYRILARSLIDLQQNFKGFGKEFDGFPTEFQRIR